MKQVFIVLLLLATAACNSNKPQEKAAISMDSVAQLYVTTILELGLYDGDIVDAYYGPESWRPVSSKKEPFPKQRFLSQLQAVDSLLTLHGNSEDERRISMFKKQVTAAQTKVKMLDGAVFDFDLEAQLLYDAQPPHTDSLYFDSLLTAIDAVLPGKGAISSRWETFRKDFVIQKSLLDTVFQAAITEARVRSNKHYTLPKNENFKVEYVNNEPWSGYNYFKGNGYSLIQINTDFPIYIERAIDLACHEGYPGHHVYNTLLEQKLVNEKGWKEYSVYPLFSPQSLVAEGSANFGIQVAFPGKERLEFEKNVLFPLAKIDPKKAELYYAILEKIEALSYAGNEAARLYLGKQISREEAANWLVKYNFYARDKAMQRTRFFDRYRSYVINYNYGQDLVKNYVLRNGGTEFDPDRRWEVFEEILSNPFSASMMQ